MTGWVAGVCMAGWLVGWVVGRTRGVPVTTAAETAPTAISVVVPARNEAERIGPLLAALQATGIDLVVVDDSSTDDTATIAAAAGARVVHVECPPGWTGKAWACWSGAAAARGDVLVFLDADTVPTEGAVRALAGRANATKGLVSVQPHHRVARWHETLSALPNVVGAMGAGTGPLLRRSLWRGPVAFGMAVAIPRAAYFATGGHSVRSSAVIDDLALARTVHEGGLPVEAWCGGIDISMRMYGQGPGQLVRGWVKNLAAGARSIPLLRTLAVSLWVATLAEACVALAVSLVGGQTDLIAIVVYLAFALQTSIIAARVGNFGVVTLVALPLLTIGFIGLFLASAVGSALHRSISWRGRDVPVGAVG